MNLQQLFEQKATQQGDNFVRGGTVFAQPSQNVTQKTFDYSKARKWAPNADFQDIASFYPSEVEKFGVLPQEQLLALHEKYFTLWQQKMPTSKKLQEEGRKNMLFGIFGSYQKDWETPILPFAAT